MKTVPYYRHLQVGTLMIVAFGLVPVFSLAAYLYLGAIAWPAATTAFCLVMLWLFWSLEVKVDDSDVLLRFGNGPIRKRIPLAAVKSCTRVRNSPLFGWGIRYIGRGWLYNVSGLDAVELSLKNERRIRIGTDDPDGLCDAVRQRLAHAS